LSRPLVKLLDRVTFHAQRAQLVAVSRVSPVARAGTKLRGKGGGKHGARARAEFSDSAAARKHSRMR